MLVVVVVVVVLKWNGCTKVTTKSVHSQKRDHNLSRSRFACFAPLTFYLHREGGAVIVKF